MAGLKALKGRIASVRSTRKVTRVMRMIASAKLRYSVEAVIAARPYAEALERILQRALAGHEDTVDWQAILEESLGVGKEVPEDGQGDPKGSGAQDTQKERTHLFIVMASTRGLCGGLNANLMRFLSPHLERDRGNVRLICIGKRSVEYLKRGMGDRIVSSFDFSREKGIGFEHARAVASSVFTVLRGYDVFRVSLFYPAFQSTLIQRPVRKVLLPFTCDGGGITDQGEEDSQAKAGLGAARASRGEEGRASLRALYGFEPDFRAVMMYLVPRLFEARLFRAMLERNASEQAARVVAMDGATRNAGEMITDLTVRYNRMRQAIITKSLIEIISGAESLGG